MKRYKLGFIGLGLIGGSIARAVRRTMPETVIVAYNRTRASLVQAMQDGVINLASDEIGSGFTDCDYIFLCMPVSRNIEMLPALKAVAGCPRSLSAAIPWQVPSGPAMRIPATGCSKMPITS